MDENLADWFAREILPHEAALTRFLRRAWPNAADVHELRQETYIRVLEAAAKERPFAPKAFLFTTSHHLLADRARRNRIVSIDLLGDLDALTVLIDKSFADEMSPERRLGARQQLARLSNAINALTDRCREIVWLRRVENLPQREIARRLNMTEAAVEKHVSRGMRAVTDALFGGSERNSGTKENDAHEESQHG